MNLFFVDYIEKGTLDFLGHLEDTKDNVGFASYPRFFLGLPYGPF